ncbi:hypothetical protein JVU11DRAFT_9948 [Chiua virens]|nr:hypothetical protein JVU11DRAFT_9948 [Chiua virens]
MLTSSIDIDRNTCIARENTLDVYGMAGSGPIRPVGYRDCLFPSTTLNPADDQFIVATPLHQFLFPDGREQISQPAMLHEPLVQEPTPIGVGETYFPFPDLFPTPAEIRHVQSTSVSASHLRDSYSRYMPYSPGSERSSWNDDPRAPVYQCQWSDGSRSCGAVVAHNRNAINHHLQTEHAIRVKADRTSQNCRWGKCRKSMRRESLPRHILAVHMKEKVLCTDCDSRFARTDSLQRHKRTCCLVKEEKAPLTLTE